MFVKPEVRKGLLARMLTELLDTRVMVKQAMKGAKNNKVNPLFPCGHCHSYEFEGAAEDSERSATWPQVHRKCHIWLYISYLFWAYASG